MSALDAAHYIPIDCGVHDRLEHWAVRHETVEVVWRDGAEEHTAHTRIVDVFAREGADWVRLGTGAEVRADRLARVGGVAVTPAC